MGCECTHSVIKSLNAIYLCLNLHLFLWQHFVMHICTLPANIANQVITVLAHLLLWTLENDNNKWSTTIDEKERVAANYQMSELLLGLWRPPNLSSRSIILFATCHIFTKIT